MTAKRDLKRRVRERQSTTGESYMTARRRVQAQRPTQVPVVELVDLTDVGAPLGLRCRISMVPALSDQVDATRLLSRLRDALLGTEGDPTLALLSAVVLRGERPTLPFGRVFLDERARFLARARAGIGGVSASGRMLALPVEGVDGPLMLLILLWMIPPMPYLKREPSLIITTCDGLGEDPLFGLLITL